MKRACHTAVTFFIVCLSVIPSLHVIPAPLHGAGGIHECFTEIEGVKEGSIMHEASNLLSEEVYDAGLRLERRGSIAKAIELWIEAYYLSGGSPVIKERIKESCGSLVKDVEIEIREALFDIENGRGDRGYARLSAARNRIGRFSPVIKEKIDSYAK